MGDWAVALILLALSLVLVVSVGLVCRVLGVYRLSSMFASGEGKTVLTKSDHGYMVRYLCEIYQYMIGCFMKPTISQ